jgi:hypothetical protein
VSGPVRVQPSDDETMAGLLFLYYRLVYEPEVEEAWRRFQNRKWRKKPPLPPAADAQPYRPREFETILQQYRAQLVPVFERQPGGWDAGLASSGGYLAAFRKVIQEWTAVRLNFALEPAASIDFDPAIAAVLPDGSGYTGPTSKFKSTVRWQKMEKQRQKIERKLRTAENIANGPLGTLGYFTNGDAGSDWGALFDTMAGANSRALSTRDQARARAERPPDKPAPVVADKHQARGTGDTATGGGGTGALPRARWITAPTGPPPRPELPLPPVKVDGRPSLDSRATEYRGVGEPP